ncbi:cytochrome oxidase maturation protein, cbb3-type [Modicisalibacter ilicicola DSM 19980]|uniref:Cytochrome oxidase maturation protein, cbb3-type n=1 Tax=Modicisalibacter ilicicola DSM 19980 TaxID=1121942 RepID=A0A1M4ULB2_9GAMM|nr:cbb3-type cytochrome oxidase assembly protein CcoS [Halomonas ilicicola]SHE57380.1 cytochrome oxidase maturation protein, cbb3-type [Halomonas ilicicola DSM 19980]
MSILYLLIPLSLLLLSFAVWAFFWAVKSGQFDDLEGPAHRILFDEDDNDLTPEQRRRKRARRRERQGHEEDGPGEGRDREDAGDQNAPRR